MYLKNFMNQLQTSKTVVFSTKLITKRTDQIQQNSEISRFADKILTFLREIIKSKRHLQ